MVQRRRTGFSFIEVMIALAVVAVTMLAFQSAWVSSLKLSRTSKQMNVANFKLQAVMEMIKGTAFDKVTTDFPDGGEIDLATVIDSNFQNNFTLLDEQVVATYVDPNAEPLEVTVTITWASPGRRQQMSLALSTAFSR